jgi:molecular chaperone DnaK
MIIHWDQGNFEVAIIEVGDGLVQVCAILGDVRLGQDHFVRRFIDLLRTRGSDIDALPERTVWRAAEMACQQLTQLAETWVKVSPQKCILVAREAYDTSCNDLLHGLRSTLEQVWAEARGAADAGMRIHMTGGGTGWPQLQAIVQAVFPSASIVTYASPQLLAAKGDAFHSANLIVQGEETPWLLLRAVRRSIGIETAAGGYARLVERNTPIPLARKQLFRISDGNIGLIICEGEQSSAAGNECIGAICVKYAAPIAAVELDVDADGKVKVIVSNPDANAAGSPLRYTLPIFETAAFDAGRPISEEDEPTDLS